MANFFAALDNSSSEVALMTESATWDSFQDHWEQTCVHSSDQQMIIHKFANTKSLRMTSGAPCRTTATAKPRRLACRGEAEVGGAAGEHRH